MFISDFGVGVDCIEISRFHGKNKAFIEKTFTVEEMEYCEKRSNPLQHYAARFAGKEAVIKAISDLDILKEVKNIEILNEESGKPYVKLSGNISSIYDFKISLSHSKSIAMAVVIASKKNV